MHFPSVVFQVFLVLMNWSVKSFVLKMNQIIDLATPNTVAIALYDRFIFFFAA